MMPGPATQVRAHPDTSPIAATGRTHLHNKFAFILYSFHPCYRTVCFLGLSFAYPVPLTFDVKEAAFEAKIQLGL